MRGSRKTSSVPKDRKKPKSCPCIAAAMSLFWVYTFFSNLGSSIRSYNSTFFTRNTI